MAIHAGAGCKAKVTRTAGSGLGVGFAALLLLAAAVSPAAADRLTHRGTQAEQAACTPDVFRLCSRYIPSESRIVACLIASRAQLSPACGRVFGGPPSAASARMKSRRATSRRANTRTKRMPAAKKSGSRTSQRGKTHRLNTPG